MAVPMKVIGILYRIVDVMYRSYAEEPPKIL